MILEDDESLLSHLLKGFKGSVKATYAKNMTKFFEYIPGADPDKIEKIQMMFTPLLATGVEGELDIEFDDEEELMENPMIEQYGGLKFSDLLGLLDMPEEALRNSPDQDPISAENLNKIATTVSKDN
jgi:hypothetical protein